MRTIHNMETLALSCSAHRVGAVGVFMVLMAGTAISQNRPQAVDQQLAGVSNLPLHKIAANDLIGLAVYDAPELTRTVRVGPDGMIDLPLLKTKIHADGKLPTELQEVIGSALKAELIINRPLVTVTVLEYNSRSVSVVGAVRKPLTFPVVGATKLLDALARAEGISPDAGPDLLLTREGSPAATVIDLKKLLSDPDKVLNVVLEGGEEIRIPEAQRVYVVGNVKKPGAVPVRDHAGATVLKMLAIVEGVAPYASDQAWIYRIDKVTSQRIELPVPLKKILARKSPDIGLEPDDVLYIPDKTNLRMTIETAKAVLSPASAAISAAIYAGIH